MEPSGSQILSSVVEINLASEVYCEEKQIRTRQNDKKATALVTLSNDFSTQFKLRVEEVFAAIDKETSAELERLAKKKERLEDEADNVHGKLHGNAFINLPAIQSILLEHFPPNNQGQPIPKMPDPPVALKVEEGAEPSQGSVDLGNEPLTPGTSKSTRLVIRLTSISISISDLYPYTDTKAGTKRKAIVSPGDLDIQNMALTGDGWEVMTARKRSPPVLDQSLFGPDFRTYKVGTISSGTNGHATESLKTPRQDPSEPTVPPPSPQRTRSRRPRQHTSDNNAKQYYQNVGVSRTSKKRS